MLQKIQSLVAAEHVLNLVQNDDNVQTLEGFIECYQNGREQGFLIFGLKDNKAIYWANHRNTDQIVVYVGSYSMQSISEDAYRNKFMSKSHGEASKYIIKQLKNLQI